ncbi:MAG: HemK family protein methyltransferase [Candidatus Parcubacteria bacterium]|nr:HemK family protein methyltransferase [Candidatus Parcubacteria bacterium]
MSRFLNNRIDLSHKVLMPRVETEFWAKKAINKIKKSGNSLVILDIFSGSGCIGIAVLKSCIRQIQRIDFADIDGSAIKQIKSNLNINNIAGKNARVIKTDLFDKLGDKKYDFILANPPYVALDRISEVQKEVLKTDPPSALFSGKDGMDCIRKFLSSAKMHLKKGGMIFMEHDPLQKKEIGEILKNKKFRYKFKKDQFKKYRWSEISL